MWHLCYIITPAPFTFWIKIHRVILTATESLCWGVRTFLPSTDVFKIDVDNEINVHSPSFIAPNCYFNTAKPSSFITTTVLHWLMSVNVVKAGEKWPFWEGGQGWHICQNIFKKSEVQQSIPWSSDIFKLGRNFITKT